MNDDEKILYAAEIAQLLEVSEEELHENLEEYAIFIADYQHFHEAIKAMQEDLEQYDEIEHRVKRLALLVTYFTADWKDFKVSQISDLSQAHAEIALQKLHIKENAREMIYQDKDK